MKQVRPLIIKCWCLLNGEKHFVWSFEILDNGNFKCRCNDGRLRTIPQNQFKIL